MGRLNLDRDTDVWYFREGENPVRTRTVAFKGCDEEGYYLWELATGDVAKSYELSQPYGKWQVAPCKTGIEFMDTHFQWVSMQPSSSAEDQCIWFGIGYEIAKKDYWKPGVRGDRVMQRMHLTRGMAWQLAQDLMAWALEDRLPEHTGREDDE